MFIELLFAFCDDCDKIFAVGEFWLIYCKPFLSAEFD